MLHGDPNVSLNYYKPSWLQLQCELTQEVTSHCSSRVPLVAIALDGWNAPVQELKKPAKCPEPELAPFQENQEMRSGKKIPCTLLSNREAVCKAASVEEMRTIVRGEISLLQLLRCPETTNFSGLLTRIPASKRQICMHSGQGHSAQQTTLKHKRDSLAISPRLTDCLRRYPVFVFSMCIPKGKESTDGL